MKLKLTVELMLALIDCKIGIQREIAGKKLVAKFGPVGGRAGRLRPVSYTHLDVYKRQAVLLDAPCSATGIFRRHPDVLHRVEDRQIDELAALQGELLARAAGWVKPGGSLVYATCSLERAEGEEQIKAFLGTNSKWQIDPVLPDELPQGVTPDAMGCVRTLPGMLADVGGLDGFFVARLLSLIHI